MSSINEAMVFEYLKEQAKDKDLVSLSIVCSIHSGSYVAAYNEAGKCGTGETIEQAITALPDMKQHAQDLNSKASELEAQARDHRERAAKILGQ